MRVVCCVGIYTGSAACLSALLLNRCNLGGDKMSQVCDAIGSGGRGIELLALDCNIRTGLFSTGEGAVAKLAGLVCTAADTRAGLKALYLRGTKVRYFFFVVCPLFFFFPPFQTSFLPLFLSLLLLLFRLYASWCSCKCSNPSPSFMSPRHAVSSRRYFLCLRRSRAPGAHSSGKALRCHPSLWCML